MDPSWFRDAAFGAFIHWGLYAVPGGIWQGKETDYIGEWLQARMRIPNAEYSELTKSFDPSLFDAEEWCRLFADAGMKYIVFTAKHHEGFAMYRSVVSPYNVVDATPFGRDPLAELAAACRKYGLKLGIYYSHCLDWHEKDAAAPARDSSTNIDGSSWGNDWDFPNADEKDFNRYFRSKVIPQVRELLTNYGPVSVMWFDCATGIMEAQCRELRELVHSLQPDCLINGRIGFGCQDYVSLGDNQMPGSAIPGLVECPATLNDTWGFKWNDHHWKSPRQIVAMLLSLAEKKVTFLLNVGPRPDGKLPPETMDILSQIAAWHKANGEAIYRTDGTPFPSHIDGVYILRDGKNLHFYPDENAEKMTFSGIRARVVSCPVPYVQTDRSLTLDFTQTEGMFPDVRVEFDTVPEVGKKLMPQNGILFLSPTDGTISRGAGDASVRKIFQDTDGKEIDVSGHMETGSTGALHSWHNPADRIAWSAEITEPGTYEITAFTRSGCHSFPWTGARKVELRIGTDVITADLTAYGEPWDPYYPTAESLLGRIAFEEPQTAEISFRTLGISSENALAMTFTGLRFKRVKPELI